MRPSDVEPHTLQPTNFKRHRTHFVHHMMCTVHRAHCILCTLATVYSASCALHHSQHYGLIEKVTINFYGLKLQESGSLMVS